LADETVLKKAQQTVYHNRMYPSHVLLHGRKVCGVLIEQGRAVVAGIGRMNYRRFLSFNVFGAAGWVLSMTLLGFTLGKVYPPITKQVDKLIIVIIAVSLIPGGVSWLANRKKAKSPTLAA
jgi:membrane-associated protein